jgi:tetratricopeptide (TPR) repeat protein
MIQEYPHTGANTPGINKPLRVFVILLILAILAITIIWITPRTLALYAQRKGSQLLNRALSNTDSALQNAFPCALQATRNKDAEALAIQAIPYFQNALSHNPKLEQAYFSLGRAYCLTGEADKAVKAYQDYTRLKPGNPLGHLELGFAYEAECKQKENQKAKGDARMGELVLCEDANEQGLILEEWQKAGFSANQLIDEGKKAFIKEQYEISVEWFKRAAIFGNHIPPSVYFQWGVASIVSGHPSLDAINASSSTIYELKDNLTIEAENLQWVAEAPDIGLPYGGTLSSLAWGNPNLGNMWWTGSAIAFIHVQEEAIYQITIRAQDTPPGPIKLQVERDFVPIDKLEMDKADFSWHELKTATILSRGVHMIGLNFLEDNGDATIDWISVQADKK